MPAHGSAGGVGDCDSPSPTYRARASPSPVLAGTSCLFLLGYRNREDRKQEVFWFSSYPFQGRSNYSCCKMEGKKSSFVDEFFPPKEASSPPKSDILSSIFPPHSPIVAKDSFNSELLPVRTRKHGSTEKIELSGESFHIIQNRNQDGLKKKCDPIIPCEIAEPCLMSSSVYYGCRDDFVLESSSSYKSGSTCNYKNDNEDACNSDLANRGEWWQGSVYY